MTTRRARRALATALAGALSAVGLFGLAPEAKAAGILPSQTALTMSANPSPADLPVVLTADISVLVKGLHLGPVTPTGTVTFSKVVNAGDHEDVTTLASVPVSSCIILLSKCVATSPQILLGNEPEATDLGGFWVRAAYSGDVLTAPSHADVFWQLASPKTCKKNELCEHDVFAGDDTAAAKVKVADNGTNDSSEYPLVAYFDTVPLSCTTAGTGDGLVVDVPAGTGEKLITLTTFGAAATKANANPDRICYSAPYQFASDATFNDGTGQWEGVLPLCLPDGPTPCVFSGSEYTPASTCGDCDPRARLETTILAPPGDPKSTR
jgi:hypothetical protein